MSRRSSSATSRRADRGRPHERGVALAALIATVSILLIGMYLAVPTWDYVIGYDREQELVFRGFEIVKGIRAWQARQGGTFPTSLKQMVEGKFLRREYEDPVSRLPWRFIGPEEQLQACQRVAAELPGSSGPPGSTSFPGGPPPGSGSPGHGGFPPGPTPPGGTPPGGTPHPTPFPERNRRHGAVYPHPYPRLLPLAVAQAGLFGGLFAAPDERPVLLAQGTGGGGGVLGAASEGERRGPFIGVMSRSERESYGIFNMKNRYNQWCFTVNTIDQSILTMRQLKLGMMKPAPGGGAGALRFTGRGKTTRDWKGKPPIPGAGSGGGGGGVAPALSEEPSEEPSSEPPLEN